MTKDLPLRLAAFDWLAQKRQEEGEVLPWSLLHGGFLWHGTRVPLVSQQGIFKPRVADLPLSIRSSPKGPYDDGFLPDGRLSYRYRGSDPNHWQNVGLREAMLHEAPLVYFLALAPGRYFASWPVYIVGDSPQRLAFTVEVEAEHATPIWHQSSEVHELSREYATTPVQKRLHQQAFRERVLAAYRQQCTMCRLRHQALLDAAHIIPDREIEGRPILPNAVALCKLHHAAFDAFFLTVGPDYRIVVRKDILDEEDGPVLRHGLQALHTQQIDLPRRRVDRPDVDVLARRLTIFRSREQAAQVGPGL